METLRLLIWVVRLPDIHQRKKNANLGDEDDDDDEE